MAAADVFLVNEVEGGLFEGEGDFDEAFVCHKAGIPGWMGRGSIGVRLAYLSLPSGKVSIPSMRDNWHPLR